VGTEAITLMLMFFFRALGFCFLGSQTEQQLYYVCVIGPHRPLVPAADLNILVTHTRSM